MQTPRRKWRSHSRARHCSRVSMPGWVVHTNIPQKTTLSDTPTRVGAGKRGLRQQINVRQGTTIAIQSVPSSYARGSGLPPLPPSLLPPSPSLPSPPPLGASLSLLPLPLLLLVPVLTASPLLTATAPLVSPTSPSPPSISTSFSFRFRFLLCKMECKHVHGTDKTVVAHPTVAWGQRRGREGVGAGGSIKVGKNDKNAQVLV